MTARKRVRGALFLDCVIVTECFEKKPMQYCKQGSDSGMMRFISYLLTICSLILVCMESLYRIRNMAIQINFMLRSCKHSLRKKIKASVSTQHETLSRPCFAH